MLSRQRRLGDKIRHCGCLVHCLYSSPPAARTRMRVGGILMYSRLFTTLMAGMLVCGLSSVRGTASVVEAFHALPPEQRRPAPAFALPDHQGTSVNLSDLRGKVVV